MLSDDLIIKALFAKPTLYKTAEDDSITTTIKNYFDDKISKKDPVGSVINLLAPGVIWGMFSFIGFGTVGMAIGFFLDAFDVDVNKLLQPLFDEVKTMISSGNKISPDHIDQAVTNAVQQFSGVEVKSSDLMHTAKIINLAALDFEYQNLRLMKAPFNPSETNLYKLAQGAGLKIKTISLFAKIIGKILKSILISAGLLIVADVGRTVMSKEPAHLSEEKQQEAAGIHIATQTKYPANKSEENSPLPSSISLPNNSTNIENVLVQYTKDVYPGLNGKENLIKSNSKFQYIKEKIVWDNVRNTGYSIIYIPQYWKTKKQMVDNFIDEIAGADK